MNIWIEKSIDNGVTWVIVPFSLRHFHVNGGSSGWMSASVLHATLIPAGVKQRMKATKTGDAGTTLTITNTSLVTSEGTVNSAAKKANIQYIVHNI